MKNCFSTVIFSLILLAVSHSAIAEVVSDDEKITSQAILRELQEKEGEELHEYLTFLSREMGRSQLTNPEIDRIAPLSDEQLDLIIKELLQIQETDPYQQEYATKGGAYIGHPNRQKARICLLRFEFQKVANRLRSLPMEERVAEIIQTMIDPPSLAGYWTGGYYAHELVVAGEDAVPFIIRHEPKQPSVRRNGLAHISSVRSDIVKSLTKIGDPRGIPYIIELLNTDGELFLIAREDAAEALAAFEEEEVLAALIASLKDPSYRMIDRRMPQVSSPEHVPYEGRYYGVQHAASKSLTQLTGHDWGFLYNEDHKTWSAWFNSEDRTQFTPESVERTEEELDALIESLFHRYMSARPNPWQPHNDLAKPEGIRSIAQDLEPFGESTALILLKASEARIADSPLWEQELKDWTQDLLLALPWKLVSSAEKTD